MEDVPNIPQFPFAATPVSVGIGVPPRQDMAPEGCLQPPISTSSQLRLTRPKATSTITRPIDATSVISSGVATSTVVADSIPAGVRSDSFSRSRWPLHFYPPMPPFPPYDPFSVPPMSGLFRGSSVSKPLESSDNGDIKALVTSVSKLQAIVNAKFMEFGNRLSNLEKRDKTPVGGTTATTNTESDEEDNFSLAPRSQEATFLSEEEHRSPSPVSSRRSQPPTCAAMVVDPPLSVEGESSVLGEDDTPVPGHREALRSRVYSIRREFSEVPMSSPPRRVLATSDFMACSGLSKDDPKGYKSFPESGHFKSALASINDSIADNHSSKSTGSKYSGFGPTAFPGKLRPKDFDIHESSLGKAAPVCDKAFSALLGAKPVDGLRLTQSIWAKSENNLRLTTNVLESAEHFLAAAGSLLKDKGEDFNELKSLLLQVDQSLGASHLLLLGTLANFSLAKRQEILEKSNVSESLKETLLFSPLAKDKLFGMSLEKLQEEVNKAPQTVNVDVHLLDGKRKVTTTSSQPVPTSGSSHGHSSGNRKRPGQPKSSSSNTGKKPKVGKGKKPGH